MGADRLQWLGKKRGGAFGARAWDARLGAGFVSWDSGIILGFYFLPSPYYFAPR